MRIGTITIPHPVTMAPMEEHTNYPFRLLAKQFGASLVCTERIDAADVAERDRRALRLLYSLPAEAPRGGQISGSEPSVAAQAARVVAELGFNFVDLNFECPIRRLVSRGEGGALMADPPAIARIVEAVVRAVSIPVTLKIRTGPDASRETAVEVACRAADAGASAIGFHARSVVQGYIGGPDWSSVARVKQAVRIPVIASGGIRHPADVVRLIRETGVDAVAIGRGCLGRPWIFRQARGLLNGGGGGSEPGLPERGRMVLQLAEGEFHLYGPPLALRRLPRVSGYFAQGLPAEAEFRAAVRQVKNTAQFRRLVKEHFG